jgi:O-antigen ligase
MSSILNTSNYQKQINIIKVCLFFIPCLLLSTKNVTVIVCALLAVYSIYFISNNRKSITIDNYDWLVISLLSVYLLSNIPVYLIDYQRLRYFDAGSRMLACIPIYFFLKTVIKELSSLKSYLEWGVITGSVGAFILAIYQFYVKDMPRVDGFLYSINFGYLACSLAFLSLTLSKDSCNKNFLYVSFILACYSTLLTLTRGAIFAIPILLIISIFYYNKKNRIKNIAILAISATLLFSAAATFSTRIQERLNFTVQEAQFIANGAVTDASSSGGRLQLWYAAYRSFLERPLVGLTYTEREALIVKLYKAGNIGEWPTTVSMGHAHNQYFELIASNGIWGILALLMMIFSPMYYFWKNIPRSNFAYSGFIFILAFSIFCLTEVPLQQNLISTYYAFMLVIFIIFTRIETTPSISLKGNA